MGARLTGARPRHRQRLGSRHAPALIVGFAFADQHAGKRRHQHQVAGADRAERRHHRMDAGIERIDQRDEDTRATGPNRRPPASQRGRTSSRARSRPARLRRPRRCGLQATGAGRRWRRLRRRCRDWRRGRCSGRRSAGRRRRPGRALFAPCPSLPMTSGAISTLRASRATAGDIVDADAGSGEDERAHAKRSLWPMPCSPALASIALPSAMSDSDRPRCQNRMVSSSLSRPGFRPATIWPSSACSVFFAQPAGLDMGAQRAELAALALAPVVDHHLLHDVGQRQLHRAHRAVGHDQRAGLDPFGLEQRLRLAAAARPRRRCRRPRRSSSSRRPR